ncbi:MAG: FAD-dependent oxidoreductase [Myxococcota bacterium]|nr:FAD-dependent oxidoreductase [Myxococcota bacterium]
MTVRRVAVVGAGIAGLTAARRLTHAGRDVTVFDKARSVGGRTSTRRREAEAFDHGAQYFTARSAAFAQQVQEWCGRGVAAEWREPIVVLEKERWVPRRDETARYVGVPGMSALAKDLATGLHVECGGRITRIAVASGTGLRGRWRLVSEAGEVPDGFDAVVVATPAPQALPLLDTVPRLSEPVRGVVTLPCQAVMVSFAERLPVDFGGAFVSHSPLAWIARNASKPGRPDAESWVLHASPEWSTAHLEAAGEDVARALLHAFGDALGRELPEPKTLVAHRWLFARTEQPLTDAEIWDGEARVGVCGDWTLGARVEDAFTSGERLARALLAEGQAADGLSPPAA